jgi:hypothetical protein
VERAPLRAAESVAGAVLVLAAVPAAWAAVSWLGGRPGPGAVAAVVVLVDAALLLLAGVLTFARPARLGARTSAVTLAGLLLCALQWAVELAVGTRPTWLVSVVGLVVLGWLALTLLPRPDAQPVVSPADGRPATRG